MSEPQQKLFDKRESFRVNIRKECKLNMLRERRAKIMELGAAQAHLPPLGDIYRSHDLNAEAEIRDKLAASRDNATEMVGLLEQLQKNMMTEESTLQELLLLAERLLKAPSLEASEHKLEERALDLILKIVFSFSALPDEHLLRSLPTLCRFLKYPKFFQLYVNLSLCKNWGSGQGNSCALKQSKVELFVGIVDQRELLSSNDIAIIENFLLSGDILQPIMFRFTNAINRSVGMDLNRTIYTDEASQVSILRSLRLISGVRDIHSSNVVNCTYIGQWVAWLLEKSNSLKVLVQMCLLLSALMVSQKQVLKLFSYNPTLLLELVHQLCKLNQELLVRVTSTLAKLSTFEEGCSLVERSHVAQSIEQHYQRITNPLAKKNLALFFINMLRSMPKELRASRLTGKGIDSTIIQDIIRDCYDPTWVDNELTARTFELMRLITGQDRQLMSRLLQVGNTAATVQALSMSSNSSLAKSAEEFVSDYRSGQQSEYQP